MINYIWLGLLVCAVLFAGYRTFFDDPPISEPWPVMVQAFDENPDISSQLPIDGEVAYFPPGVEPGEGSSLRLDYDLAAEGRDVLPIRMAVDEQYATTDKAGYEVEDAKPEALTIQVYGDESGNRVLLRFEDAEGDAYVAPLVGSLDFEGWKRATVPLDSLVAEEYDPTASPAMPLEITGFVVVGRAAAEKQAGTIYVDDLGYQFAQIRRLSGSIDTESTSWMGVVGASMARWAEISIELAIGLIGIMMFWLGLMRVAEAAGLVLVVARLVKPIMVRLFPEVPAESDAMGAIIMNMAANMLGLGNAATPLGLKAMKELQAINPRREHASNAMCMLLALNTSSVTLISVTIIGYRAAAGSGDLFLFWPLMVAATLVSTTCAIIACKTLERLPMFAIPPETPEEREQRIKLEKQEGA